MFTHLDKYSIPRLALTWALIRIRLFDPSGDTIGRCTSVAYLLESITTAFSAYVSAHVTSVKRRRNALLRINRLPPEILAMIFQESTSTPRFKKRRLDALAVLKPQLVAASVCSWWRSVIHCAPHLWTTIPYDNGRLWYNAIRFSGDILPLDIVFKTESNTEKQLLRFISNVPCNRWHSLTLDISGSSDSDIERIEEALAAGAPMLESITCVSANEYGDSLVVPHLPKLQRIHASGSSLELHSLGYALPLRYLHLSDSYYENEELVDLLAFLAACPSLEELMVRDVDGDNTFLPNSIVVNLPNLTKLTLSQSCSTLGFLLSNVRAGPSLRDVRISDWVDEEENDAIISIQDAMRHPNSVVRQIMQSTAMSGPPVLTFFSRNGIWLQSEGGGYSLNVAIRAPKLALGGLVPGWRLFDFEGCPPMCIALQREVPKGALAPRFLGGMPTLTELRIDCVYTEPLQKWIDFLSRPTELQRDEGTIVGCTAPNLVRVIVPDDWESSEDSMRALVSMVRSRREMQGDAATLMIHTASGAKLDVATGVFVRAD